MIRRQLHLQKVGKSLDPPTMTGEERGWYATWNHTAVIKELGEALDEIAWKPWSVDKDTFNRDQFVKELVDGWHFVLNLLLIAGDVIGDDDLLAQRLADEFYTRYITKSAINMRRFKSGDYDSKTSKCPDCGRDVEDGEKIVAPGFECADGEYRMYRCTCGRVNPLPHEEKT